MQSVSENYKKIWVSSGKRNPGEFASVTEALNSIPKESQEPVTILIAPGIYHEKITVDKPFVTLEGTGTSNADTVLTFDDYANFVMEDGTKMGTFRSYSVFVDAHDVTFAYAWAGDRPVCGRRQADGGFLSSPWPSGYAFYRAPAAEGNSEERIYRAEAVCAAASWKAVL